MKSIKDQLRVAAKAGDSDKVKTLLRDPECDALSQDDHGRTALMCATCYGHLSCVGLLLPVSDALIKDRSGWTALMYAADSGDEACIELLLPASDPLTKDNDGWTALMWAAYYGYASCIDALLPVSDLLAKNIGEKTASQLASKGGHVHVAQSIDAYALAQKERLVLNSITAAGSPQKRSSLRV